MLLLNKKMNSFLLCVVLSFSIPLFGLQLGDGTEIYRNTPIKVMENAKQVYATTYYNTFVIKEDNSLWVTGFNYNDFLKLGVEDDIHSFVKIMDGVKSVSEYLIIKEDDSLWYIGERGIEKIDENVIKASKGAGIMYIKKDLTLWAYGGSSYGNFGVGVERTNFTVPIKLRDNVIDVFNSGYSLIITSNHDLYISGSHYLPSPYKSPVYTFTKFAENVRAVSEGFYITKDNVLYGFGYSAEGALGVGDITEKILPTKVMENVKEVSSSQSCAYILTFDGLLYSCGGWTPNYFGALGTGDNKPRLYPTLIAEKVKSVSVGSFHAGFIKEDGSLWMCGANSYPPLQ